MRTQQARGVDKIIQSVMANGTVIGVDGEHKLPTKVKIALKSLLEARTSEPV